MLINSYVIVPVGTEKLDKQNPPSKSAFLPFLRVRPTQAPFCKLDLLPSNQFLGL